MRAEEQQESENQLRHELRELQGYRIFEELDSCEAFRRQQKGASRFAKYFNHWEGLQECTTLPLKPLVLRLLLLLLLLRLRLPLLLKRQCHYLLPLLPLRTFSFPSLHLHLPQPLSKSLQPSFPLTPPPRFTLCNP